LAAERTDVEIVPRNRALCFAEAVLVARHLLVPNFIRAHSTHHCNSGGGFEQRAIMSFGAGVLLSIASVEVASEALMPAGAASTVGGIVAGCPCAALRSGQTITGATRDRPMGTPGTSDLIRRKPLQAIKDGRKEFRSGFGSETPVRAKVHSLAFNPSLQFRRRH
jgi:hypothetical protein